MQNLIVTIIYYLLIVISIGSILLFVYFLVKRKLNVCYFLIPFVILSISYTVVIKNNSIIWKEIYNLKPLQDAGFKTSSIDPNIIKDEFLTMFEDWVNKSIFTPKIGVEIKSNDNDTYAEIYSYGFDLDDDNGQYNDLKVFDILVPFKNGDILIQRWKIEK